MLYEGKENIQARLQTTNTATKVAKLQTRVPYFTVNSNSVSVKSHYGDSPSPSNITVTSTSNTSTTVNQVVLVD